MPTALWSVIIQAALPLGIDLVNDVIAMIKKDGTATPITEADWQALSVKWASKSAEQYLDEAIKNSGAPTQ